MGRGIDLLGRLAFIAWALLLFTLTHWPDLQVKIEGIERTDLLGHAIGYSTWTALLIGTGWLAPRGSWKSIGLGMPIALLYSGIDEASQWFIPGRFVSWTDFAANSVGVWIGAAVWVVALLVLDARSASRTG